MIDFEADTPWKKGIISAHSQQKTQADIRVEDTSPDEIAELIRHGYRISYGAMYGMYRASWGTQEEGDVRPAQDFKTSLSAELSRLLVAIDKAREKISGKNMCPISAANDLHEVYGSLLTLIEFSRGD